MMRGCVSALILLCFSLALSAQSIDIPEVVVAGESSLRDTLRTQQKQDLEAFWRVAAPARFVYRYQPPFELSPVSSDSAAHEGLASLEVGSPLHGALLLAYADREQPLLNFWVDARTDEPEDKWKTNAMRVRWWGDTPTTGLEAKAAWSTHSTPLSGATLTWWTLGASVDVLPGRMVAPLTSLRLRVAAHDFLEETNAGDRGFSELDVVAESGFAWRQWAGRFDVAALKSAVSAQMTIWRDDIAPLDRVGVWLAGDSEHIYGSVAFFHRFELGDSYPWIAAVNVFNDPGMGRRGRDTDLAELPTQHIDGAKLQVKRPIDLNAVFEYNTFLPLSMSYRFAWLQDAPTFVRAADSLYVLVPLDATLHEANLAASYTYSFMRIGNELTWRLGEPKDGGHTPWIVGWENRFSLRAERQRWSGGLLLNWLADRRDEAGLALDDVVLVDLDGFYSLSANLRLRVAITNLLDESYRPYPLLPAPGLGLSAGFDYNF
ncbi:MAG: hypothetical protein K8R90_06475 [Candidatus Cloacimonetes bacterium]|nr:hypothetical protein [Candidatus Cloacimonadota bacterium]